MLDGNISGVTGANFNTFMVGMPPAGGQSNPAAGVSSDTGSASSASITGASGVSGFNAQTGLGGAGVYTGYVNQYMGGGSTSYVDTFNSSNPLGFSGVIGNPNTQPINIDINSIPAGSTSYSGTGAISNLAAIGTNSNLQPYDVNALINSGSSVATGNPNLQPIDLKKLLGSPEELDKAGEQNPLLKQVQASLAPMSQLMANSSGTGSTAKEKAYNSIPAYMRNWEYFSGPNGVLASLDHYEENKTQRDAEKAAKMNGGSSGGGGGSSQKSGGLLGGFLGGGGGGLFG